MNASPIDRIGWGRVALCLICLKIIYGLLLCLTLHWWGDLSRFESSLQRWPLKNGPVLASHFTGWDSGYYLSLSQDGYKPGDNACAFYPLWPILIHGMSRITMNNPLLAGLLLTNLLSLAGWILFYAVAARRFGSRAARHAVALLVVFPGSIFYQLIYTESIFFLLLMLLWLACERRRPADFGLAWGAAFLLPLSRGVGLFSVAPLAWDALMRLPWRWPDRLPWLKLERERAREGPSGPISVWGKGSWPSLALVAAPVLGWSVYLGLMAIWTGNPLEGMEAQKYWKVHSVSNLWNVPKFVVAFFSPTTWHEFNGSVLDRAMFVLLLYFLPLIWCLGRDLFAWSFVLGVLPAMSGEFVSFTRFESVMFPLFVALAVFFKEPKRRCGFACFAAGSMLLHLLLLWRFVNCRWAG